MDHDARASRKVKSWAVDTIEPRTSREFGAFARFRGRQFPVGHSERAAHDLSTIRTPSSAMPPTD